jgi:hypothetical protein
MLIVGRPCGLEQGTRESEKARNTMPNVYVEPRPVARAENEAIDHYVLEFAGEKPVTFFDCLSSYRTQAEAIAAARELGYHPLIARVRVTNKGEPDHWRSA